MADHRFGRHTRLLNVLGCCLSSISILRIASRIIESESRNPGNTRLSWALTRSVSAVSTMFRWIASTSRLLWSGMGGRISYRYYFRTAFFFLAELFSSRSIFRPGLPLYLEKSEINDDWEWQSPRFCLLSTDQAWVSWFPLLEWYFRVRFLLHSN
jgi:hypothetical protein